MAEVKITDLVDESAIKELQQLGKELDEVVQTYENAAKKLAEGLRLPIEGKEDIDKLYQIIQSQTGKAQEANERLNGIIQKQNEILGQTTNTISRGLAEIEKENAAKREAYNEDRKAVDIATEILGTRSQNIKRLAEVNSELKANADAQRALTKEEETGLVTGAKAVEKRAQLLAKENELKISKSELTNIINNEEKMNQAAAGSYQQLSLKLELMKKAYKQLNEEEKAGAQGQALSQEIASTDAHLKDLAADMGEFQRNVGNYATAQTSVKTELRGMIGELASLTVQWRGMSSEEKNSAAGQDMKKHMDELTVKAGALKDAVGDVKKEVGKQASDTQAFDAIAEGVNLVVSGFGAATGAAQMLGLSEKDVLQIQADLQASLAVSNALTQAQNSLQRESALMQGIMKVQLWSGTVALKMQNAAQGENIIVTGAATVAQKLFNAVAKANPYVLLAGAILTLVGALGAFVLGSHKETDALKASTAAREKENAEFRRSIDVRYQLADASRAGAENSSAEIAKLAVLYGATQNHTKSMKERLAAVAQLKKEYPATFANLSNEAILAGQAASSYDKLTKSIVEAAIAEAQMEKIKDIAKKVVDYQIRSNNLTKMMSDTMQRETSSRNSTEFLAYNEKYNNQLKTRKELSDKAAQGISAMNAMAKNINVSFMDVKPGQEADSSSTPTKKTSAAPSKEKTAKDWEEIQMISAKGLKELADMKAQNAKEYSDDELQWTKLSATAEAEIRKREEKKALEDSKKELSQSLKQKKISQSQYSTELEVLESNHKDKLVEIDNEAIRKKEDADSKYAEGQMNQLQDVFSGEQAMRDNAYQRDLAGLHKALAEKKITQDEFDRQEYETTKQYTDDTYNATVSMIEKQLSVANISTEEKKKLEAQLAKAKVDYVKQTTDIEISNSDKINQKEIKLAEDRKKRNDKTMQALKQFAQSVQGLFNAVFQAQTANIEKQEDALQKSYDKETERIETLKENKIISDEEAEARKRAAKQKTEQKEAELERKKAAIQKKQAIFDKATQLAGTGMATARGIMEAMAMIPPNIPLAAIIGAMGAVQTATILATPIPSYAKGTEKHKGGPALVGDAGRSEVVLYGGSAWLTPDKPTLMNIPKGAKVLPKYDKSAIGDIPLLMLDRYHGAGGKRPYIINNYKPLEGKIDRTNSILQRLLSMLHRDNVTRDLEIYKQTRL